MILAVEAIFLTVCNEKQHVHVYSDPLSTYGNVNWNSNLNWNFLKYVQKELVFFVGGNNFPFMGLGRGGVLLC